MSDRVPKREPVSDAAFVLERACPEPNSGCWLWTKSHNHRGYGAVSSARRGENLAHRLSFRAFVGTIPPGLVVRHSCDTPACVNPAHLLVGTLKDNSNDAVTRGRHLRGSQKPEARLTEAIVRECAQRYATGATSFAKLAREYGVDAATVRFAVRGKTWKHVEVSR